MSINNISNPVVKSAPDSKSVPVDKLISIVKPSTSALAGKSTVSIKKNPASTLLQKTVNHIKSYPKSYALGAAAALGGITAMSSLASNSKGKARDQQDQAEK